MCSSGPHNTRASVACSTTPAHWWQVQMLRSRALPSKHMACRYAVLKLPDPDPAYPPPLIPPPPPAHPPTHLPRGHGWLKGDISNLCQHPAGVNHSNRQSGLCEGVSGRPFTRPAANQVQDVREDRTQEQPALQIQVQFSAGTGHLLPRAAAGGMPWTQTAATKDYACMLHTQGCRAASCEGNVPHAWQPAKRYIQAAHNSTVCVHLSKHAAVNKLATMCCSVKGAIWWRASSCSPNMRHPSVHQKHCCRKVQSNSAHQQSDKLTQYHKQAAQLSCKSRHCATTCTALHQQHQCVR